MNLYYPNLISNFWIMDYGLYTCRSSVYNPQKLELVLLTTKKSLERLFFIEAGIK